MPDEAQSQRSAVPCVWDDSTDRPGDPVALIGDFVRRKRYTGYLVYHWEQKFTPEATNA